MTELLAMTCDACGEPMLPNVSTLDEDGCLWICINPRCPELRVGELEAADLEEAGVSAYNTTCRSAYSLICRSRVRADM